MSPDRPVYRMVFLVVLTPIGAAVIVAALLLFGATPRIVFLPGHFVIASLARMGVDAPNAVGVLSTVLVWWALVVVTGFAWERHRRRRRLPHLLVIVVLVTLVGSPGLALPRGRTSASDLRLYLAFAAERQIGVTKTYDPSYRSLPYPAGDVAPGTGVCADVVVRAFREIGIDLQVEVHEDMKRHFREYPQLWGLRGPNTNIDHRRVPNLMAYFRRRGKAIPLTADYRPGDVVAWRLPRGLHHIGVVANFQSRSGKPLVVHNIGRGAQVEDVLDRFPKVGHYRW